MTIMETNLLEHHGGAKRWMLCRKLWKEHTNGHGRDNLHTGASSSEESPRDLLHHHEHYTHPYLYHPHPSQYMHRVGDGLSLKSISKAFLHRRRLSFEPSKKLLFPYEQGKKATSAVRIMNVCRSNIAFKFQTTAPRSCFMRPPCGVLLPGESIVATVVKHIHRPHRARANQAKEKFKIISLKMMRGVQFSPEIFDEQTNHVVVEQILRVQLVDPGNPTADLEKLKLLLAEADAANEACKKVEKEPARVIGAGNILEEWNKMKQARHMGKALQ